MKYLFLLVIIAASLVSCNEAIKGKNGEVYKTAVQYNDYIISRQNRIVQKMLDLKQVAQTNLDSANTMLDNNIAELEEVITDIKGMPPYKGDSSFRNAAIASFTFYKKIFGHEYKQIISIRKQGRDITEEGMEELNRIIADISHEEEKYDKTFHNTQKNFAERNNMRLEKNTMQKKMEDKNP